MNGYRAAFIIFVVGSIIGNFASGLLQVVVPLHFRVVTDAQAAGARVVSRIRTIRGLRAMLDAGLATLQGVTMARLNQQVRRNRERSPDFAASPTAASPHRLGPGRGLP
jgi:hypothetical protein